MHEFEYEINIFKNMVYIIVIIMHQITTHDIYYTESI